MKNDEEYIRSEEEFGTGDDRYNYDTSSENFTTREEIKTSGSEKKAKKAKKGNAEQYILPGEKVLWNELAYQRENTFNAIFIIVFSIAFMGIPLYALVTFLKNLPFKSENFVGIAIMSVFILPFILCGIFTLVKSFKGEKNEYVITDKRVIIVRKDHAASIKFENVVDVHLIQIGGTEILTFSSKYLMNDNLLINQVPGGKWTISGVSDVRMVYQLLLEKTGING